jgi:hypothetical protein
MKTTKNEALELLNDLDKLLTERIEELHKIQGMQQARHAYIYYRSLLWEINDKVKEIQD